MKKILLLYLLIITISLKNAVEFGKEITFSRNNNNLFEFTFNQYGLLFVQIDFPKNNLLELKAESKVQSKYFEQLIQVTKPGISAVIPFDPNKPVKIILSYINPSDEKGIIWMNPSTVEIKVDLNKKYEWKYDFSGDINCSPHYKLIYSIDKAEKDMILQFKYNENIYIPSYNYGGIHVNNPLKICPGGDFAQSVGLIKFVKENLIKFILLLNMFLFHIDMYIICHLFQFNLLSQKE